MAKYMECDVCGTKQDGTEAWIEAMIPAPMLGEMGEEYLSVDVCSIRCLSNLGQAGDEPEEPMKMADPYPEPDPIEPETAEMAAAVYEGLGVRPKGGKKTLKPVQASPQAAPMRYPTEEEIEQATGVTRRW